MLWKNEGGKTRRARCAPLHLLPFHPSPGLVLEVLLEVADGGLARDGGAVFVEEFLELVFESADFLSKLLRCHNDWIFARKYYLWGLQLPFVRIIGIAIPIFCIFAACLAWMALWTTINCWNRMRCWSSSILIFRKNFGKKRQSGFVSL